MNINADTLKKPQFWAVAIPAVLMVWALFSSLTMLDYRARAKSQLDITRRVQKNAHTIESILKRANRSTLPAAAGYHSFDSVASARRCAKAARIPESNLDQGESRKSKKQKDGSELHRETFNLKNVKLLQIARFIDYAERNYSSLSCTQATITDSRNKSKDAWDATINFKYFKK